MRKDIFIDNNIAKNFSTPNDNEYKKLISWLWAYEENKKEENAVLVVSNKLLAEYSRSSGGAKSSTNIMILVSRLIKQERLEKISNQQIKEFQNKHFKKSLRLQSNMEDHDHIPVVLLSERKFVLTIDEKLICDLRNFPGFSGVKAEKRPELLPYK